MSRLYLICGLCGRQQADGLLSRGYWGHVEISTERTLRACPTCKEHHRDWEERLRVTVTQTAAAYSQPFPQAS